MRPLEILQKHIDLNPKLTIAASVHEDGKMLVHATVPGNLPDLVYLHYCLGQAITKMHEASVRFAQESQARQQDAAEKANA